MSDRRNGTAIITSAGQGLGRHVAVALANLGMNVVVNNCVRSSDQHAPAADRLVDEVRKLGVGAIANYLNLEEDGAGDELVADALASFGNLTLVIHHAGLSDSAFNQPYGSDRLRAAMDASFFAANALTRAACPAIRESGGGSILYLATPGSGVDGSARAGREASRAALYAYMRTVAAEGKQDGIAANAIAPILEPPQSGVNEADQDHNNGAVLWLVRWLSRRPAPLTGATFLAGGRRVRHVQPGKADDLLLSTKDSDIFKQLDQLKEIGEGASLKDFEVATTSFSVRK